MPKSIPINPICSESKPRLFILMPTMADKPLEDLPSRIWSWSLATINMWMEKVGANVEQLIQKHLDFNKLYDDGVVKLNTIKDVHVSKAQGENIKLMSENIIKVMIRLRSSKDCPRFLVPSEDLHLVPGVRVHGPDAESDAVVSTRLTNLENKNKEIMSILSEIRQSVNVKNSQFPPLQSGVSVPAMQVNGGNLQPSSGIQRSRGPGGIGGGGAPSFRNRSLSSKRGRDDGDDVTDHGNDENSWSTVTRRRRPAVKGASKAKLDNHGVVAAPFEVVVGNTHPDSDEELIKEVLIDVSRQMPENMKLDTDLKIEVVECLTKPREGVPFNPWSKSWRIRVENRFKEHILRPEAIPEGWTIRKYFPKRQARPPAAELHPNKKINVGAAASLLAGGQSSQQQQ